MLNLKANGQAVLFLILNSESLTFYSVKHIASFSKSLEDATSAGSKRIQNTESKKRIVPFKSFSELAMVDQNALNQYCLSSTGEKNSRH